MKTVDMEVSLREDIDIYFDNIVKVPVGGGGVYVYSAKEELPQQGNESFLYIVRKYGTFYWDTLTDKYEPIPLYNEVKEKIFITADGHRILTKDNYIFKPIM